MAAAVIWFSEIVPPVPLHRGERERRSGRVPTVRLGGEVVCQHRVKQYLKRYRRARLGAQGERGGCGEVPARAVTRDRDRPGSDSDLTRVARYPSDRGYGVVHGGREPVLRCPAISHADDGHLARVAQPPAQRIVRVE